jgi:EAL domain-containing protein (putative c-di-GMP-specific phosphodiesterase class I)/GGDEF domain-containing protein
MIKNREKRIRKMKRTKVWIFILAFVVVYIVGMLLSWLMIKSIDEYVVNGKVATEYARIERIADVYSELKGLGTDDDAIRKVVGGSLEAYAVLDKEGNVLFGRDHECLGEFDSSFMLEGVSSDILLYKSSDNLLFATENNLLTTKGDVASIVKYMFERLDGDSLEEISDVSDKFLEEDDGFVLSEIKVSASDDESADSDDPDNVTMTNIIELTRKITEKMKLPLWLGAKTADGGVLVSRCYVVINGYDLTVFLVMLAVIYFIAALLFIIFLITVIITLVNERKNLNLYFNDTITCGPNRNMYLYNGEKNLKKRRNLNNSYAVVSLLFTKYNNYCLCHSMKEGEIILTKIHRILSANMTKGEIAAHMTIAEFALLLHYDNRDSLETRLRDIIKQLDSINPDHAFVFHAGVKVINPAKDDPEDRLRKNFDLEIEYNNACTARIPKDDKDDTKILFFDDKLIEEQHWEDKIIENQFKAIENEEFVIYYQPKYEPNTNKLSGAEALIRWNSPELGFVSPGRFIPQFEKSGFITEIDHYMLSHVAKDQKRWMDEGFDCVPVSVNVSRAHFIESDLAEQIRDIVEEAGAPCDLIEIELTESAFFDDKKALINTITRLKEYGFTVSMDDFGSGYSSLNSLKDIPLDVLKLDAGFFSGDISDDRSGIVVSETIRLAKSLNMKTVAEGVELKEQVEFLAAKGCDMIQGFFYAKPMPASELEERFAKKS